jgi:hypothetical protein
LFARLKPSLGNRLKRGIHCRDCFHWEIRLGPILALLVLILILFLLIAWLKLNGFQRITLISIGVVVGLVTGFIDRVRLYSTSYPIGFPLFSKIKVEVQERIKADFNIDGRPYLSPDLEAEGVILITLTVSPNDRDRQESISPLKFPSKFHAGFVALETLKNIDFIKSRGLRHRKNLLMLIVDPEREVFERRCRQSGNFYLSEPYRIKPDALQIGPPDDKQFPLFIKPRRTGGGYCLEIMFEIPVDLKLKFAKSEVKKKTRKGIKSKTDEEKGLEGKPILNSLVLHIPTGCDVDITDGHFDQQKRVIKWYKSAIDVKPVFSVFVQFQQLIPNDIKFKGEYSLVIKNWTISQLHIAQDVGAQNKHFVRPTNGLRISASNNDDDEELKWLVPIVEHSTKIEGKICIDTSRLMSQQVQAVSDLLEKENGRTEIIGEEKLPVAPTHHVINALVKALTEEKVFIKEVIETPGHVTDTSEGSNRAGYWTIRGKYYLRDALRPADLHLVISGDGTQNSRPNSKGKLALELSLRSYIEMGDQKTPEQLKYVYEKFRGLTKIATYRGRQIDYQGRRIIAWKLEEQIECRIQKAHSINKVAVILVGENKSIEGYVFIPSNNKCKHSLELPEHLEIRPIEGFPMIRIPGVEWVDKWELLRELEGGVQL